MSKLRILRQTFQNKLLRAGAKIVLGSDATGDTYYRDSNGLFTRLGIGSTGNVLTVASGLPSWAAPASTGAFTFIKKTADEVLTSVGALQDDDDFSFAVTANQLVVLHYNIVWDTGGGSAGLQARILLPSLDSNYTSDSNLTLGIGQRQPSNGAGSVTNSVLPLVVSSGTVYSNTNVITAATPQTLGGWVLLPIGSSGGTVKIQWCQNSSSATPTTFRKGSYLGYLAI